MLRPVRRAALITVLASVSIPSAQAAAPPPTWPPARDGGELVAHFGEEHWNDADGQVLLSKVVDDVARYQPLMVAMSGDKANNGVPAELDGWSKIIAGFDRRGIPWFAGVGNHDRDQQTGENALTENAGGVTPIGNLGPYRTYFASRPYPMGDAPPVSGLGFPASARPAGDPVGASSHYFVDAGLSRWIFIDNSCYGIVNCEPFQNPPNDEALTQYEFLRKHAAAAKSSGRRVFVVMHMPTQDPVDQTYRTAARQNHVMGKGASPDNAQFEAEAAAAGVDGVFLGHIKGQFVYRGQGNVPYYTDGGAGGELYSTGPVGTDHGYWHGYRLLRVSAAGAVTTDAVPIFVSGSLRIDGPAVLLPDQEVTYSATGRQPVTNHARKVDALELRDPAPADAEQATSTRVENLPNPARIWTSGNPRVLSPVASSSDDPRRDARIQTADGTFRARCPGFGRLWLSAGWETQSIPVHVRSAPGPIAGSLRLRPRASRSGSTLIARLTLRQAAVVRVSLRSGRRTSVIEHECVPAGSHDIRISRPRRGRYRALVEIRSDRPRERRGWSLRIR